MMKAIPPPPTPTVDDVTPHLHPTPLLNHTLILNSSYPSSTQEESAEGDGETPHLPQLIPSSTTREDTLPTPHPLKKKAPKVMAKLLIYPNSSPPQPQEKTLLLNSSYSSSTPTHPTPQPHKKRRSSSSPPTPTVDDVTPHLLFYPYSSTPPQPQEKTLLLNSSCPSSSQKEGADNDGATPHLNSPLLNLSRKRRRR